MRYDLDPYWVQVYDRVNPERLLGFFRRSAVSPRRFDQSVTVAFAVVPPLSAMPYDSKMVLPDSPDNVMSSCIHLRAAYRPACDGWLQVFVWETDATLADLSYLREFRYPGETEEDQRERLWRYG